jgi:hypothetical protein
LWDSKDNPNLFNQILFTITQEEKEKQKRIPAVYTSKYWSQRFSKGDIFHFNGTTDQEIVLFRALQLN